MSQTADLELLLEGTPRLLPEPDTDTLLRLVQEQLKLQCFDPYHPTLLKWMVENVADSRGIVRLGFTEAFGAIGEPAVPFLLEALAHHDNPVVRRSSAKALAIIANPSSIPVLIQTLLTDEDTVVRGSSVGALARVGKLAVPALLDILASSEHSDNAKGHVSWALSFIGAEAAEHLYPALDSELPEIRCAVVVALASGCEEQWDEKAFDCLKTALTDPAVMVRAEAANALGRLGNPVVVPPLVACLQDEVSEVRRSVALSLMKIGDRTAIAPLQSALAQETDAQIQPILKLAIDRIDQSGEDDWD